jgi:hypothetical protein
VYGWHQLSELHSYRCNFGIVVSYGVFRQILNHVTVTVTVVLVVVAGLGQSDACEGDGDG